MYGKRITKDRLIALQAKKTVLIADVRTPENFRDSSIKGSVNLFPTRNFVNKIQTISNKKQPIVIVGSTPDDDELKASHMYAERLGFENIYTAEFSALRDD